MPCLVITRDNKTVRTITLERGTITIGSGDANDIQLDDPALGECHARVATFFDVSYLERVDSSHRIEVNGKSIQLCRLRPGDRVAIGSLYRIVCASDMQAPAPDRPANPAMGAGRGRRARLYFLTGPEAGRHIDLNRAVTHLGEESQPQAVIHKHRDGYYLSRPSGQGRSTTVRLNERSLGRKAALLRDKDVIEVKGVLIAYYDPQQA